MCDEAKNCGCRTVVTRVYRELRERRIAASWAFETAARIFRLHHPEVPETEARRAIAEWLGGPHENRSLSPQ